MNKRKVIIWAIGTLIFVWIVTTAYFYTEHQLQVERITINEYVELDGYIIYLMDVEKYNFERVYHKSQTNIFDLGLPDNMTFWLLKIKYFYSKPYEISEDLYTYELYFEVIYDDLLDEPEQSADELYNKIKLEVYEQDQKLFHTTGGRGADYSDDMNVISCSLKSGVKLSDADMFKLVNDDGEELIQVELNGVSQIDEYDYFNQRYDKSYNKIVNFMGSFIGTLESDNIEAAETYIHESYKDTIFLDRLMDDTIAGVDIAQLTYEVQKANYGDEFQISVKDGSSSEVFELTIVYEDARWWIVGIE